MTRPWAVPGASIARFLLSGKTAPATWGAPDPPRADVFAVKGVLEALGAALRLQLECRPGAQPFLHPGRSATVLCDGQELGWLGELHPLVAREWGSRARR